MIENRHLPKVIAVLMAAAVLVCLLAVSFSDRFAARVEHSGVSLGYVDELFGSDEVIHIDIRIAETDWSDMLAQATNEQYYPCDVSVNDTLFYSVGIRPKGHSSLSVVANDPATDRYSFKLEFDHYVDHQTCFGLDKLVLNNHYADATNMKEAVVYDMYALLEADAPLYNYASVSVNGSVFGTYLALEAVEDSFLLRNYGTTAGKLYRPEEQTGDDAVLGADLNYQDDRAESYTAIWESAVSSVSRSDQQRVIRALRAIHNRSDEEQYMDVENLLKYMAVHTFAVNYDSLSAAAVRNYYLYEERGKLNLVPWDYNLAFGGTQKQQSAAQIINFPIDSPFLLTSFFDGLLEDAAYRARYHAYLRQLSEAYGDGNICETTRQIREKIDLLVSQDPTAFYSYAQYDAAVQTLNEVITLRAESVRGQLDGSIPATHALQDQNQSALIEGANIDIAQMGTVFDLPPADMSAPEAQEPDLRFPAEDAVQSNAILFSASLIALLGAILLLGRFRRKR